MRRIEYDTRSWRPSARAWAERSTPSRLKPAFSSARCSATFVDVGGRLDPVDVGRREQVRDEQPLGSRPDALAAGSRRQRDADVQRPGPGVGPVPDRVPADVADGDAVQLDDQASEVGRRRRVTRCPSRPTPTPESTSSSPSPLRPERDIAVADLAVAHSRRTTAAISRTRSSGGRDHGVGRPPGRHRRPAASFGVPA